MTKNSSFSCFMVIFMSYCPQFFGSRRICMHVKNPYMFDRYHQKLVIFVFYGRFHEILPIVLGFQRIWMPRNNNCMFERHDQKLYFSCFMAVFMSYCP